MMMFIGEKYEKRMIKFAYLTEKCKVYTGYCTKYYFYWVMCFKVISFMPYRYD